jgi:hypothetical protein
MYIKDFSFHRYTAAIIIHGSLSNLATFKESGEDILKLAVLLVLLEVAFNT